MHEPSKNSVHFKAKINIIIKSLILLAGHYETDAPYISNKNTITLSGGTGQKLAPVSCNNKYSSRKSHPDERDVSRSAAGEFNGLSTV